MGYDTGWAKTLCYISYFHSKTTTNCRIILLSELKWLPWWNKIKFLYKENGLNFTIKTKIPEKYEY